MTRWFWSNGSLITKGKPIISTCHFLVIKRIGDNGIKNSEYENLLGIKVDAKLNFNEHLSNITSEASRKVKVL